MKINLPTNLFEFILSGILLEILLILMIPNHAILNEYFSNNFFSGLVIISGGYILGLVVNAISTPFFDIYNNLFRYYQRTKSRLDNLSVVKNEIKELFELEFDNLNNLNIWKKEDRKTIKQINNYIEQYVKENSEDFRKNSAYQMRVYRMSRNSFVICLIWIVALRIFACGEINSQIITSLKLNSMETIKPFLIILILVSIALFIATDKRLKYITGTSFYRFIALVKK